MRKLRKLWKFTCLDCEGQFTGHLAEDEIKPCKYCTSEQVIFDLLWEPI